jgi:hypothetical protein
MYYDPTLSKRFKRDDDGMFPGDDWWQMAIQHDDELNKELAYDDVYDQILATGVHDDDQPTHEMFMDDDKVFDDFNPDFEDDQRWADDIVSRR